MPQQYMIRFWFLLISLQSLFQPSGIAQQTSLPDDSPSAFSQTISLYQETIKDDSFLDEGREYIGYTNKIGGHAFFEVSNWETGKIFYKGQLYKNVPLLYDLADEEVVVRQYSNPFKIKLFKEEVSYFSLRDHHFVRIKASDAKGKPMVVGFYDRIYGGETQVLVKRKKNLEEKVDGTVLIRRFVQENQVYIQKEGGYYPVKRKGSVLRVLKDQKKEIRRYLKKNQIFFRKDPESTIVKMVEFYDQATAQP